MHIDLAEGSAIKPQCYFALWPHSGAMSKTTTLKPAGQPQVDLRPAPAAQTYKAAVLRDLAKSWLREAHHVAELNNQSLTPDARAGTKAALAEWQAK